MKKNQMKLNVIEGVKRIKEQNILRLNFGASSAVKYLDAIQIFTGKITIIYSDQI